MAATVGQSLAATSAHLKVLRSACLVETRKEGRNVYYRPSDDHVGALLLTLRRTGERLLPEVREVASTFLNDKDALAQLSGEQLLEQVRTGVVTLIDLRPVDEFDSGHFPGARSVPAAELEEFMESAEKDRPVIAYCRGPFCLVTVNVVSALRERGFNAKRFPMGVLDWRDAGFVLERRERSAEGFRNPGE